LEIKDLKKSCEKLFLRRNSSALRGVSDFFDQGTIFGLNEDARIIISGT